MRWISLVAGSLLVLAACGSDASESTAADGETRTSPIADFLGQETYSFDNTDEDQARIIAEERERQEVIAACMRDQGFEYIPVDPESSMFFDEAGELEWGSDEWVAKYGFGITTMWFTQDEVGPDLVGNDFSRFEEQQDTDPNQTIVEAMSLAEQDAYYAALYGEDQFPELDETLTDEEIEAQMEELDFQPSGCEANAYLEQGDVASRFYDEFSGELDDMYQRVENDPRFVEAQQEISGCVAEKGFDFTSEEDMYERFDSELMAIESSVDYPGAELTEEDFAKMTPDELDEIFNQPRVLSDDALATLAEIQEEEITLAVAVNGCGGGFARQGNLFQEILTEYEQQFLDDNEDRLADFEAEA